MKQPPYSNKIGFSRKEFGAIFQIYSQNVYHGLFRDFSFSEIHGKYYISFRQEAGKTPLITIEKQRLGPDRVLFIATTPAPKNTVMEIARSEQIEAFCRQVRGKIEILRSSLESSPSSLKKNKISK